MEHNTTNQTWFYRRGGATDAEKIFTTVAYTALFPLAVVGNLLTIYIVFKKRYMRSVTNLLLVNMFIGNLLVALVAMPYSVAYMYLRTRWIGGTVGLITCKLVHFGYTIPIAASNFALILSSIDRYFAVVYPFKQLYFIRNAKASTTFIWVSSFICMSPYLYAFTSQLMADGNYHCIIDWAPLDTMKASGFFYLTVFLLLYAIPLVVMATLYFIIGLKLWNRKIPGNVLLNVTRAAEKAKRKVVKMLVIVVVVFALSWLPAHTIHMITYFNTQLFFHIPWSVRMVAFWTCHANSAICPFLFLLLSEKFRSSLPSICKNFSNSREKKRAMTLTTLGKVISTSQNNSASTRSSQRSSSKKEIDTTLL